MTHAGFALTVISGLWINYEKDEDNQFNNETKNLADNKDTEKSGEIIFELSADDDEKAAEQEEE